MREPPVKRSAVLAFVAPALLVTGIVVAVACGSGDDSSASDAPATETSAEGNGTTAPPEPASTLPPAADGTDIEACRDGNCEVEVSGPVDIPLTGQGGGLTTLSVDELTSDGLEFTTTSEGGGTRSGGLGGEGCIAHFYENGLGTQCIAGPTQDLSPPPSEPGVLAVQLVSVTDGSIVLRFVAG